MNFFFIAVNYNGAETTVKLIDSVLNMPSDRCIKEVIIIDNDSSATDKEALQKLNSIYNVQVIFSNKNIGYFGALNIGLKVINKNKDDIVILCNNDITFEKNFITNFLSSEYNDNTMVVAPNIITKEGRRQNPHVYLKVSRAEKIKARLYFSNYYVGQFLRILNNSIKKVIKKTNTQQNKVEYPKMVIKRGIGACYILLPFFFQHNKKLDDLVFLWGEEAIFSHQIEQSGGITVYDPQLIVHHDESASVASIANRDTYKIRKESYKIYRKFL